VHVPDRTLLAGALGLAVVALAGGLSGSLSWPVAGFLLALSAGPMIESGLRIVERPLPAGRPRLPHALRVTISTEVAVELGLRVVCDAHVPETEALVQTGRGSSARQGVPAAVRESRNAWLFVVRNSPGQRELFLRVDLFSAQPFKVVKVSQIRAGGAVILPEWKELDESLAAAPAAESVAGPDAAPAP